KPESSHEPLGELQELPATAEDFAYSQSIAIPDPESIATRELTVAELPEARLPRGMSRQDILFPSEQGRRIGRFPQCELEEPAQSVGGHQHVIAGRDQQRKVYAVCGGEDAFEQVEVGGDGAQATRSQETAQFRLVIERARIVDGNDDLGIRKGRIDGVEDMGDQRPAEKWHQALVRNTVCLGQRIDPSEALAG